ncbi:hypothetical protein HPB50_001625 [Hyalomma asiaticum]|uniref:Uncharacterized protein n=1 Tax=Hyalomma asiaticum TaxID=266040 RepID=A0ACB7SM90_HYAAI|nr:hypothetical protein HPB50_001625 [Hyalomma asiaticum]
MTSRAQSRSSLPAHASTRRSVRSPAATVSSPGARSSRSGVNEKRADKGVASPRTKKQEPPPDSSTAVATTRSDVAPPTTGKDSDMPPASPRPNAPGSDGGLAEPAVGASQPASPRPSSVKAAPSGPMAALLSILPKSAPASVAIGKATAAVAAALPLRHSPQRGQRGDEQDGGGGAAAASAPASPRMNNSAHHDVQCAMLSRSPSTIAFQDQRKVPAQKAADMRSEDPCPGISSIQRIVGVIAIFVIVVVVLVLLKVVWYQPPSVSLSECLNGDCSAYSYRLLRSINTSVDPCRDFTHFVCDGWSRSQSLDVREDQFHEFLHRIDTTLKGVDVPLRDKNEEQRAADLYRKCDDVLQGNRDDVAAVKAALHDAGIVWPRQTRDADPLRALVYSSIQLGWDALLSFQVITHRGQWRLELHVDPGRSFHFLPSWPSRNESSATALAYFAYFEFLSSLFDVADARNGSIDMYEQMQRVAAPALHDLSLLYNTWERPRVPAYWLVNASGAGLSEGRWLEALRSVYIDLPGGVRIATENPDFLARVVALWTDVGEDSFHIFVSWCTVQVAALYTNRDAILNYYGQISEKAQVHHRALCFSRAVTLIHRARFQTYFGDALQENVVSVAKGIALSVRLAFSQRLSKWAHFEENVTVIADWSSLDIAFRSFERSMLKLATPAPESDAIPEMAGSFVDDWPLVPLGNKRKEEKRLMHAICRLTLYAVSRLDSDFQLMPYSLSAPFFDPGLPVSVRYGTFGSEIAGAIGAIFVDSYRERMNAPTNLIDCLKHGTSGSEIYSDDNVARAVGFRALVDAYKRADPASSWPAEGFEQYTGLELLFMSACLSLCSGRNKAAHDECELLAQHVPEFDEAFRCAPKDRPNPSVQCQLP